MEVLSHLLDFAVITKKPYAASLVLQLKLENALTTEMLRNSLITCIIHLMHSILKFGLEKLLHIHVGSVHAVTVQHDIHSV